MLHPATRQRYFSVPFLTSRYKRAAIVLKPQDKERCRSFSSFQNLRKFKTKYAKYVIIGVSVSAGCYYLSNLWGSGGTGEESQEEDIYIPVSVIPSLPTKQHDYEVLTKVRNWWFIIKAKYLPWLSSIRSAEDVHFSVIWYLLQSFDPRLQSLGIQLMINSKSWQDYQYRMVAQTSSVSMLVKLARSHNNDARYFLPMPDPPTLQNDLGIELRKFVTLLSDGGMSPQLYKYGNERLEEEGIENVRVTSAVPEEKVEIDCLEIIANQSMDFGRLKEIYDKGGLLLLHHMVKERQNSLTVKRIVSRILANMSLDAGIGKTIVKMGWLSHIVPWTRSEDLCLSLQAVRILSNLDRTSRDRYHDGIYLLHLIHPNGDSIDIDIIFIHGLRGGPFKTWRQQDLKLIMEEENKEKPNNQKMKGIKLIVRKIKSFVKSFSLIPSREKVDYTYCWPKDWLAKDCEDTRIINVGCDAGVFPWEFGDQRNALQAQGRILLNKLRAANIGSRPVVWVGHSVGGLLIKQILTQSDLHPEFGQLCQNTRGVVFISTPHRGTPVADKLSKIYSQEKILEIRTDSLVSLELHTQFIELAKRKHIQCLSFGETEATTLGGFSMLIVPPDSSDPGIGEFHLLKRNHLYICKPQDKNSDMYKLTVNFIRQCASANSSVHHKTLKDIIANSKFLSASDTKKK